jgi:hypothetical protein
MLNVDLIKQRMRAKGLTGPMLAEACEVSKQAVSDCLTAHVPRPRALLLLAEALDVEVDELLLEAKKTSRNLSSPTGMRGNRLPTWLLRRKQGRGCASPAPTDSVGRRARRSSAPADSEAHAVAGLRRAGGRSCPSLLKLNPVEAVTHKHLFELFEKIGAVLVPVFWGGDKDGHENAMSVYLPDSCTTGCCSTSVCRLE